MQHRGIARANSFLGGMQYLPDSNNKSPQRARSRVQAQKSSLKISMAHHQGRLFALQVFVISSDKIFKENYSNMYTLMVTNAKSGGARLVLSVPQKFQPAVYLLMHCALCWVATLAAVSLLLLLANKNFKCVRYRGIFVVLSYMHATLPEA